MDVLTRQAERRSARRRSLDEVPHVAGVKVSSEKVDVVNASRGGILVQGTLRLNPGTDSLVEVLSTGAPARVRGRVVRCEVIGLSGGTRYRIALAFNRPLDVFGREERAAMPCPPCSFGLDDLDLGDPDPSLAGNRW